MKLNLTEIFRARFWTLLMLAMLLATVTACGGGNGSAGAKLVSGSTGVNASGGTLTTKNGAITLTLTDSSGAAATSIPSGAALTAKATLTNASGAAVSGVVVTFSVSNNAGVLSPALGTALSDSNGIAQITLSAGLGNGAATLTASATIDGTTAVTNSIGFTNGAVATTTVNPVLTLSLLDSSGANSSTVSTSNPLTASAKVVDSKGVGIAGVVVTFSSTATLTQITPSAGTAITNASGIATVTINPLSLAIAQTQSGAAGTVTATATPSGQTVVLTDSKNFSLGATSLALSLKLVLPTLNPSSLNAYASTSIEVGVYANGSPYTTQPVVVNFTSGCAISGKATMPTSAATVNGIASVTYTDNGCSATDVISATVGGVSVPATATLNVAAPVAASINFISAAPSDKSIVIHGAGGNGRSETAILTFKVVDINGAGLKGQTVTFTNNFPTIATLNTPNAVSQSDGTVTATVNSLALAGTFRISAALASGLSTISDSITVTTGQPIQAAFSLSTGSYNIEGWSYDNVTTTLTALIADSNGNPVADGTPVVATTDSGAVGTSAVGGCQNGTVNGACTMPFRSQNPRFGLSNTSGKRAGMATVTFNSSNSTTVALTGTLQLFLSDSYVAHVYNTDTGSEVFSGNVFTTSSCSATTINLEFDDLNFNPMPSGSVIGAGTTSNVAVGTILPSVVPSIAPHGTLIPASAATRQAMTHNITLTPDSTKCVAGNLGTFDSTFTITVTTPKTNVTVYNFILRYPH